MPKIKIIADKHIPFLHGIFEPYAEIIYLSGKDITKQEAKDADCLIIRTRTKIDKQLLDGSRVQMVASATIGHDHIDKDYCRQNNISWTNAPGCNSWSVRQYVSSVLANLYRLHDKAIFEKTLGIIGVGNVGSKVAEMANSLGMKVLLNDPPRVRKEPNNNFVGIEKIIDEAEIITIHVPLYRDGQDKTFHLFDDEMFTKLKRKPFIINSARGEVVCNEALKKAIDKNYISGAVIDTWENEPLIDGALLRKTIAGTPHIAGYSLDGKANGTMMAVSAIAEHFGLPLTNHKITNICPPAKPIIEIDSKNMSNEEIWSSAIISTYDVMNDDRTLREKPANFETNRENYPLRREPLAFNVILKNLQNESIVGILENAGFKVSIV